MDDALFNIFQFIKQMNFIKKIPNIEETKKNLAQFTVLVNVCFEILSSNVGNARKKQMLKNLEVFDESQIEYIIANQNKIVRPFEYIHKKRNSKTKKIRLMYGGNSPPVIDGVSLGLLNEEQRKSMSNKFSKLNVDVIMSKPEQATLSQILKVPIPPVYEKLISMDISKIQSKITYLLSIPIEKLKRNAKLLGIPIEFDFKSENRIFKMIDKNVIMQLLKNLQYLDVDMISKPPISMKDWIFYPLWSLENTPFYGPMLGVPIDYLGVMASQLSVLSKVWGETLGVGKDSFVQAIMSAISLETAGAGLVAAPFIAPAINKLVDMGIHIVSNLGSIMNLFINISRKNFGMAYILFCEIVPVFENFMDTIINYMVIVNRALNRNNHYLDILDNFLDNTEIVSSFSNPLQYEKLKEILIQKAKQKIEETKKEAELKILSKLGSVQENAQQKIASKIEKIQNQNTSLQKIRI